MSEDIIKFIQTSGISGQLVQYSGAELDAAALNCGLVRIGEESDELLGQRIYQQFVAEPFKRIFSKRIYTICA